MCVVQAAEFHVHHIMVIRQIVPDAQRCSFYHAAALLATKPNGGASFTVAVVMPVMSVMCFGMPFVWFHQSVKLFR